jgi:MoaA/NifB/PqqE/SkfB family radical SAM enzyme
VSDDAIADVWDDPSRDWPSIVYVETTNLCNARCLACTNPMMQRPRRTMTLAEFKAVADKVRAREKRIGAMFCSGEPLLDKGIEEKYRYARATGVLTAGHVGLNTNASALTEDRFDSILANVTNVILSFFNVGAEYERLTGGLSWERSYGNAIKFIEYRDRVKSNYPIFVSVNKVAGHNLEAVKDAFAGRNVNFVQDAELRYEGNTVVDGVLDRMRMYHDWRCDGYRGVVQVKPDLSADFCAYDIVGTPTGGETRIGHFLDDGWDVLERNFRERWKAGSTLCRRCDYWTGCKRVMREEGICDPAIG